MLMRFSVSNFLSFGYKTNQDGAIIADEFRLYAGRSEQFRERVINLGNRKVLKFVSVYGANAAGKTNLIKAMDCGKQIVLSSIAEIDCSDKYCRNKNVNKEFPTLFEYEFSIDGHCFAYGFTVNLSQKEIASEWLYELEETEEHPIFERRVQESQYYFDEKIFKDKENLEWFHFFMKDVNRIKTSLLLYEIKRRDMDDKDFDLFSKIYDWFRYKLMIIYPDTKLGGSYFRFASDNVKLINILNYFDTGITGYDMKPMNRSAFKEYFSDDALAEKFLEKKDVGSQHKIKSILKFGNTLFELDYGENDVEKISKLMFQHGKDETSYEYGEESDGTQRLIELLDVILNDEGEKVFLIDELDRSLHPQMTIKFVETFMKFSQNINTQLIITTHESNLMDLKILRRDEIWLAEREFDNSTTLYPLEKFKIRYDKVVSKDYLAGRYGAVPAFKDFEYVWGGNGNGETEFESSETV